MLDEPGDQSEKVSTRDLEFTRRGRMLDGSPVFCTKRHDVKEARFIYHCANDPKSIEEHDSKAERDSWQMALKIDDQAQRIASWRGEAPEQYPGYHSDLKAQGIVERASRHLFVIRQRVATESACSR